ncbi:MAG: acyltransferase [Pseudomonadota bacterium]
MTKVFPTVAEVSAGRDNNLNLIRLLAASGVFIGHCWPLLYGLASHDPISSSIRPYSPFDRGIPGLCVYVFFFLSGFLVTRSMVTRNDLIDYIVSRISRIYPALIVVVFLLVFLIGPAFTTVSTGEYFKNPLTWKYLLTNSLIWEVEFLLPGMFPDNVFIWVNGSLWTLPAELRFYVLVACLWALGVFTNRTVFNLVAVGLALMGVIWRDVIWASALKGQIELGLFFLAGASLYMNRDLIRLTPLSFFSLIILSVIFYDTALYNLPVSLAMCFAVAYVAFALPTLAPQANRFGDLSYGVYIYAYPVQQLVIHFMERNLGPWTLMVISTPIIFILAGLSWFYIEKPALDLKTTLLSRRKKSTRVLAE